MGRGKCRVSVEIRWIKLIHLDAEVDAGYRRKEKERWRSGWGYIG